MSIPGSLKYLFILIISWLWAFPMAAQDTVPDTLRNAADIDTVIINSAPVKQIDTAVVAKVDTTLVDSTKPKPYVERWGHQITMGIDVYHPINNYFSKGKEGYEFQIDYYYKRELYWVLEGGWGHSDVNYSNLVYHTTNQFYRVGFNKTLIARDSASDWDMYFIGLRLAMAPIQTSEASYTVVDSLWGSSSGSVAGRSYTGVWAEIAGGMRVELIKGLMAGWTIRGKFLLNATEFKKLAPLYVAGYGRGDKNTIFDFDFYISYALRWKRG
jgi:Domain of unknown function (DUF6048)